MSDAPPQQPPAVPARSDTVNVAVNKDFCKKVADVPLTIKCGDIVVRREHGAWLVETPNDVLRSRALEAEKIKRALRKVGVDPVKVIKTVYSFLTAKTPARPTPYTVRLYNPLRDYLEIKGPVLGVVYIDDKGQLQIATARVEKDRLKFAPIDAVIVDESNDVIYTPLPVPDLRGFPVPLPEAGKLAAAFEILRHTENPVPMLITKIMNVLKKHVTLGKQEYYAAVAAYIVAAYFTPIFHYFPVLRIGKPGYNAGGTTLMKLICALAPGGQLLVDPTDATNYVLPHFFRSTLCIDEVKGELSEERVRRLALFLDAGFDRDIKIPRMLDGGRAPTLYQIFGPRIVVDPQGLLTSYSNARRQLVVVTLPDPQRREIASIEEYRKMYDDIVHELYAAYLLLGGEVKKRYASLTEFYENLDGATLQAYGPLLVIASFDDEIRGSVLKAVYESVNFSAALRLEADPTKVTLKYVVDFLYEQLEAACRYERNPQESIDFKIHDLRIYLREKLSELKQVDISSQYKRYWHRLEGDFERLLSRGSFVSMMRQYLARFVITDKYRKTVLHFANASELWEAIKTLAAALNLSIEPPCPLESLIPQNALNSCAAELAEHTREPFDKVLFELKNQPEMRLKLCAQGQRVARSEADIKAETAGGGGGRCPEGWVFDEITGQCFKQWI